VYGLVFLGWLDNETRMDDFYFLFCLWQWWCQGKINENEILCVDTSFLEGKWCWIDGGGQMVAGGERWTVRPVWLKMCFVWLAIGLVKIEARVFLCVVARFPQKGLGCFYMAESVEILFYSFFF